MDPFAGALESEEQTPTAAPMRPRAAGRPASSPCWTTATWRSPTRRANRRLDTLTNIIATGHAGLLFVIPGRDQTLRLNGRARVTCAPEGLERLTAVGRPPRSAIVVAADEVYAHCPRAFVRARIWHPEAWPALDGVPTAAEVMAAHHPDPARTAAAEQEYLEESLRLRLA